VSDVASLEILTAELLWMIQMWNPDGTRSLNVGNLQSYSLGTSNDACHTNTRIECLCRVRYTKLSRLLGGVFECPEVHLLTVVKILPCSSDTMTRLICDDNSERTQFCGVIHGL
jgi:hypothetical protein